MDQKKIAVIGAGPAGITAAYQLTKAGYHVEVYEASDRVGGLSKSLDLWNQRVDLGPHRFFSDDNRVNSLWLEVVGQDYRMVDRLTRIYYKKKFYYYPLKPFDAIMKLGLGTGFLCVMSYFKEKVAPVKKDGSFETWVIGRFGRRLYSIFFKTYSEKLWGISCRELDEDFAAQRIKKLSLFEAVWKSIFKGKNKHKTLVDQFAYPTEGSGMVYERMQQFVDKNGGRVLVSTAVKSVITTDNKASGIELENGEQRSYDHIISTMPMTLMVQRIPDVPANVIEATNQLRFRNTLLVYLKVEGKNVFPDNWLYVHADDLQMGRITNFSNWVPEINKGEAATIVVLEYWAYDEDPIWKMPDEDLIELGSKELRQTGLVNDLEISAGHVVRIPRCYPVYNKGYKTHLKVVENYLDTVDHLSVIGRYGSFKYNNQDHSILMGILSAENIAKGAHHNLWEINTDYEAYQERSTITATGLQQE